MDSGMNSWDLLETSDSIMYAESLMLTHLERAIHELDKFPSSMAKSLLMQVAENVHKTRLRWFNGHRTPRGHHRWFWTCGNNVRTTIG